MGAADLKSAREIPAATLNGAREKSSQPLPIIDDDLIPRDNIYLYNLGIDSKVLDQLRRSGRSEWAGLAALEGVRRTLASRLGV